MIERPYIQDELPSAGHASASTSKRAEPKRASAQHNVLLALKYQRGRGLTGHEANRWLGKPETTTGQSALSTLHLAGKVERLIEERDEQKIYVLPEYVLGRPTGERGSHGAKVCRHCGMLT